MSRKGESITLSLSAEEKAELEKLAFQFGCTWGDKPNISALLKAIASGRLKVFWDDEIPETEIKQQMMKTAIEKIKQGLEELSISF